MGTDGDLAIVHVSHILGTMDSGQTRMKGPIS